MAYAYYTSADEFCQSTRVDFTVRQCYNKCMYRCELIADRLASAVDSALKKIDTRVVDMLCAARREETDERAAWALDQIIKNARIAENGNCYPCQDTGVAMLFVRIGTDAQTDGDLTAALTEGVRRGYREARKSIADPLTRLNTGDNTPPVIYYDVTGGNGLEVTFLAKGAGSENMGGVRMLTPSKGRKGIIDAVVGIVRDAGANPCPPILLGVGVGGTMDKACLLSKLALIRECGRPSADPDVALLESEILESVNALGIGAQGLGGNHTALACAVETFPTHIGMLPVAVTIQCHSVRHAHINFAEDNA